MRSPPRFSLSPFFPISIRSSPMRRSASRTRGRAPRLRLVHQTPQTPPPRPLLRLRERLDPILRKTQTLHRETRGRSQHLPRDPDAETLEDERRSRHHRTARLDRFARPRERHDTPQNRAHHRSRSKRDPQAAQTARPRAAFSTGSTDDRPAARICCVQIGIVDSSDASRAAAALVKPRRRK